MTLLAYGKTNWISTLIINFWITYLKLTYKIKKIN